MPQHQSPAGRVQERSQQGTGSESGRMSRQNRSQMQPFDDLLEYARTYARERPETFALACFGVGFILGWRLKPW
jgi:hypothetical protein